MPELLLNIAALSRRTGVAPDTLRKWELRYHVLRPERSAGGQRRYTESDVQRVEWLRDRIGEGWRIGEAARMLDGLTLALDEPADLRDALIAAVRDVDMQGVAAALDQAFAVLPLEQALLEVVSPALVWTGDAWHRGELSVAQEHALTAKVRAHLEKLLAARQGEVNGVAVLACAPGEYHDIGLLMLAVSLRGDGWRVEFLGADTPVDTAVAFADTVGATLLCFSASRPEAIDALAAALPAVLPDATTRVAVGGAAVTPEIARTLGVAYAGGKPSAAVTSLRRLART